MKALVKCVSADFSWTNIFEGVHPYMITFLGKPIIDFYIDYLLLCNVSEITIVVEKYDLTLFKHVHSRSKWGTPIKIEIEEDFSADNSYNLVCEKFCLICYDKNFKTQTSFFDELKNSINTNQLENVFKCNDKLPPYVALSKVCPQIGETAEAMNYARKATNLAPENFVADLNMGEIYLENELFENASVFLERGYQKHPSESIKNNLVKALIGISKQANTTKERKLFVLRKVLKFVPENKEIEDQIKALQTPSKPQNAN